MAVPFELGLDGHSDKNVVAHTCDAVLGMTGLPDLGHHRFPIRRPPLAGRLQHRALPAGGRAGGGQRLGAGQPGRGRALRQARLGHLTAAMAANLAAALGLAPAQVRVTAEATDSLGFSGRGEGIAATAVCLAAEQPIRG